MSKNIPFAPWVNPTVREGVYAATVEEVRQSTYGQHDDPMLKLVFQLAGHYIVSHIYFPREFSQKCQQRFSFFCQAIDVEPYDVMNDPEVSRGKRLAIDICTVHPRKTNYGQAYSDVRRFLPIDALGEDGDQAAEVFVGEVV